MEFIRGRKYRISYNNTRSYSHCFKAGEVVILKAIDYKGDLYLSNERASQTVKPIDVLLFEDNHISNTEKL